MNELAKMGAIVEPFLNDRVTRTSRAIPAIWCGNWTAPQVFSDPECGGQENNQAAVPTIFEYYRKHLGIEPRFGAPTNRVIYFRGVAQRPAPQSNPELYTVLKRHLRDLAIAEQEEEYLLNFVRNNISRGLIHGTATLDHIAAEIGLEPRTLQRRLKVEGSSFQALVDEVRLARAKYYLEKTRLSITDVAQELGYAEASVFVRAFKRLTGNSPNQYRKLYSRP